MFRLFKDENLAQKVVGGANAPFQAGVNHQSDVFAPEAQILLPWLKVPESSWLDYECGIECILDAGMALHKPLPQSGSPGLGGAQTPVDTLGSYFLDAQTSQDKVILDVNLKSQGNYTDVIQRMATSTYTFVLTGFGVRAGWPVPVPALKTVAGVPATPGHRQWTSGNRIIANFYGIPVFRNEWELWYFIVSPPKGKNFVPPNLAEHIRGDQQLPSTDGVQVAVAPNDYNSVATAPPKQVQLPTAVGGVGVGR